MSHKSDTDEANVLQFVNYIKDKPVNGFPPLSSENDLDSQALIAKVRNGLSTLTPKHEQIVRMRFGLSHKKGRKFTFEEIGYHFRLSRQTVNRHLHGALEKLEESGVRDILENIDRYEFPSDF
jgi:DNA-directed RNA polymerase sigma subunit (sigma70/sigma32)